MVAMLVVAVRAALVMYFLSYDFYNTIYCDGNKINITEDLEAVQCYCTHCKTHKVVSTRAK
jgi:hypothetical protein